MANRFIIFEWYSSYIMTWLDVLATALHKCMTWYHVMSAYQVNISYPSRDRTRDCCVPFITVEWYPSYSMTWLDVMATALHNCMTWYHVMSAYKSHDRTRDCCMSLITIPHTWLCLNRTLLINEMCGQGQVPLRDSWVLCWSSWTQTCCTTPCAVKGAPHYTN